jgi:hypothetical protein
MYIFFFEKGNLKISIVIISEKGNLKLSIVRFISEIINSEILKLPFSKKKMYIKNNLSEYLHKIFQNGSPKKSGKQK